MSIIREILSWGKLQQKNAAALNTDQNEPVLEDVSGNLAKLQDLMGNPEDLKLHHSTGYIPYGLAYLESLVQERVIKEKLSQLILLIKDSKDTAEYLSDWEKTNNLYQARNLLLKGYIALFLPDLNQCFLYNCKAIYCREPVQPEANTTYKGSKDGFVEDIRVNLFLIRSRLKDHYLRINKYTLGRRSQSQVYLLYLRDLADPELVKTVSERLQGINTEIITNGSEIAQFIQDSWLSPFPQIEYTERPDEVIYALSQGRVAIVHDSSPGVLLAPTTFFDLLDTPDDHYDSWTVSASIIRFIRLIAVFIATFLPSFYIALTAYNKDFIPTSLAFLIAAAREDIPFPIPVEAFLIVSIVEIGREAAARLPEVMGLLMGATAILLAIISGVAFHLVSVPMIIVILFSVVCASVVPDNDLRLSMRELQFFFMLMASFLGIFGVAMAFFYVAIHAVTLKSFGIPYMSPVAPFIPRDWGRLLFRVPTRILPRLKTYQAQTNDQED